MATKITFKVAANIAENATSGLLLGDFNNWNSEQGFALKQQKDGSLATTISLEEGTYQYRYLLNDGRWVNDGSADGYSKSHDFFVDNCVITVAAEATKATKAKKETPVTVVEAAPEVKKVTKAPKAEVVAESVATVVEKKASKSKKAIAVTELVETKKAPVKAKK